MDTYKNITDEELSEAEEMASLFFSPKEICIAMGWDGSILESLILAIEINDHEDLLFKTFFKGRLTSEIELRRSIKQAASNGSNPAQDAMLKFMQKPTT